MPIKILSAAISGIDAQPIEVEVDSSPGIFAFNIVGLASKAVDESKDRIGSAIKNTGFTPPKSKNRKVTVNLAPADIKKEGPAYDLPIALGYLMETDQVKFETSGRMFAGELSLDGALKKTSGILAITMLAQKLGLKEVIIPKANVPEAATVEGIGIIGAENLSQVLGHLDRTNPLTPAKKVDILSLSETYQADHFSSIIGQEYAKRALIVAAAGGHNILMSGPPGSGKTILAKALGDILPSLSQEEAVEVAKIYSSLGISRRNNSPFSLQRPFRNPHHTTSSAAIVGGGSSPRPGEITLAHRGVLFFDELPEYHRDVLEALRQPLENGSVTVSRASGAIDLPAKFMFVGAMNPCPCGNYGEERLECSCLPYSVLKYRKRVSGPLLDRMDIQVTVSRETIKNSPKDKENSQIKWVRDRISQARAMQSERFKGLAIFTNSEIDFKSIDKLCVMDDEARDLAKKIANQNNLSFRGYHRIIKVARTIADLEEAEVIKKQHVAEAIALRINDNMFENLA